MTASIDDIRAREFPWTLRGDRIYLNHASTGPMPVRACRVQAEFNERRGEPWRITHEDQFGTLRRSRELCAALIGASPDEIALMVNTTYGINVAAACVPLTAGDVVVSSDREFPANVYPWMALERRKGIVYQRVPYTGGVTDEEGILRALDQPRVKVLTISSVSFETGFRVDLERLGAACRERDIWFVVDAIQGVGAAPIDVRSCHADFVACGAQKWLLSPWGSGFLYVRRERIAGLEPQPVGWMAVRGSADFTRLCDYALDWYDDARRFEVITLPFPDFAGMNASLELFHEIGLAEVHRRVAERTAQVVAWAQGRRDVRLVTPADPSRRAGIVSVAPRDPVAASRRLHEAGVVHAVREGSLRLAPHFYTSEEEIDRALALLGA
ncbi:MAG TPA: aminotransferase class V-fold PLP-dependent enzyme [Gemmatimonadaceae bacterium]